MLKIQSDISRNSASFGNSQPQVIILGQDNSNQKAAQGRMLNTADVTDCNIKSTNPISNQDYYTQEDYDSEKSFLEQQKENVENLINNADTPKPVKTFGKIVLGTIAVAMGFVSMRWATLGSWKVAEDIITNPKTRKLVNGMIDPFKNGFKAAFDTVKKYDISKKTAKHISEFMNSAGTGYKSSKAGKVINKFADRIVKNNTYKKVKDSVVNLYKNTKDISKEKVKNSVSNFFGVSGAVTAGVDAIQQNSRTAE